MKLATEPAIGATTFVHSDHRGRPAVAIAMCGPHRIIAMDGRAARMHSTTCYGIARAWANRHASKKEPTR